MKGQPKGWSDVAVDVDSDRHNGDLFGPVRGGDKLKVVHLVPSPRGVPVGFLSGTGSGF